MATNSQRATLNADPSVSGKPGSGITGIDGGVSSITFIYIGPGDVALRVAGGGRAIVLSSTEYGINVAGMLRKGNELRHGTKGLIQVVKRVAGAAHLRSQAAVAIKSAIDAAIICKIHHSFAVDQEEVERVLIGVHMRDGTERWRASVGVGQIQKCAAAAVAVGRTREQRALVQVNGAGINVGADAIGQGGKLEIKKTLCRPTAGEPVSAVVNSATVDLRPRNSAVRGAPDSTIVVTVIDIPDVHFVAARHDSDFTAIKRANLRGRIDRAEEAAQPSRLIGQSRPVDAVIRYVKAVPANGRQKFSGGGVVDHRGDRTGSGGDG